MELEDVVESALETLRPKVSACRRIDQLARDANTVVSAADAALKQVSHAKFTPHLARIKGFSFVLEARIASDDE